MKIKYLYLLPLAFAIFACEEEKPEDLRKPGIDIRKPASPDTAFVKGDTLFIEALVADNDKLKEVHVELINESDSSHAMHFTLMPNVGNISFDTAHVLAVEEQTNYLLRFHAVDFANNEQEKTQRISVALQ